MKNLSQTNDNSQPKITHQKVCDPSGKIPNKRLAQIDSSEAIDHPADKLRHLPDQALYQLCKNYGQQALHWRQKFIGLLPKVNRRKLFEKKGFESIFMFAKKLAGLSEEQVRRALNLEKKFENLPNLKSLLVHGEVSLNKLARVASIANSENEMFLAGNIKNLSQGAVETLVRDEKWIKNSGILQKDNGKKNQNGLFEAKIGGKSVRAHTSATSIFPASSCVLAGQSINLSLEVQEKLLELQQKGLDLNQLLLEFLQKRELEIARKKEQIRQEVSSYAYLVQKEDKKTQQAAIIQEYSLEPVEIQSHYIPRATKKILQEEYGTKCAVKNCQKTSMQIHHTLPFAIGKTHDPRFLVPLCKEHHELQHAINIQYRTHHQCVNTA